MLKKVIGVTLFLIVVYLLLAGSQAYSQAFPAITGFFRKLYLALVNPNADK